MQNNHPRFQPPCMRASCCRITVHAARRVDGREPGSIYPRSLSSRAGCRITIQAASLHACGLQGAESPSKLPASMPAGLQAKSTQIHLNHVQAAESPSKLPASMPACCRVQNHHPSCQPPCLQASRLSHPILEVPRLQTSNRATTPV